MKKIELSDEAFAALQRLAAARNLSPAEAIAAMLSAARPPPGSDLLLFFITSEEFTGEPDPTERYLNLLAWCARNYAGDFADFISHQESGLRYLMFNRDEINGVRARNHARQIGGTQFWAVLTIADVTKRHFICRLLEFIGCHDETVGQACHSLGLPAAEAHGFLLLSA
ncbi:MAG: hypothetical protein EXS42_05120 [Lacunisphaera sp.]|nr:hypothetical protein [Lacunisphaera sp.]